MNRILIAFILIVQAAPQQEARRVRVITKEGHSIVGTLSLTTITIEGSLGRLEYKLNDLTQIRFEGDQASIVGKDGTTLKGKLELEKLTIKGTFLEAAILRESLVMVDSSVIPPAVDINPPTSKERPLTLHLSTIDGNQLKGTTEAATFVIETSLGKVNGDLANVNRIQRDSDKSLVVFNDGTLLRGTLAGSDLKIRTEMGEFAVKVDKILGLATIMPPKPPPPPAKFPPDRPSAPPEKEPSLAAATTRSLEAAIDRIQFTRDGSRCYGISRTQKKIYAWSWPDLEPLGEIPVSGSLQSLDLIPDETALVAVGDKFVAIIDTKSMGVRKTFAVEKNLLDVLALDSDQFVATGPQGTVLVSIPKTAITQSLSAGASRLFWQRDLNRILVKDTVIIPERGADGFRLDLMLPYNWASDASELAGVSPDGRYGLFHGGIVRLGKCWEAARTPAVSKDLRFTTLFAKDSQSILLFTADGNLKFIELKEGKELRTESLNIAVLQAVAHPDGRSVLAMGFKIDQRRGYVHYYPGMSNPPPMNLYRYELAK